ncbi:uncharacterized protein LOC124775344 [Schistocerca piceifrons]|uniref:uncharacterized protein LOC124775344 n=1 Tax=Schistocerca piceifrons TaxID=274613 RepID=UPI001F5F5FAD|nr:uncharacterized protein LOC124775344 [Schistocerca piceifrons]
MQQQASMGSRQRAKGYYIFIRSDGITQLGPNPLELLVPLKHDLWLAIMFTLFAYTIVMGGIFYLQRKPLCDAIFSVIGAFVQKYDETTSYHHRITSEQCLRFAAYITGSVLLSAYSAGIISILTVSEQKLPFQNFAEIEQDGSYMLSVTGNSFEYDFFKLSQQMLLQKLFSKQMDIHNPPRTKPEGLSRVCTENKYAFLSTDLSIQSSWNHQNCNVIAVPIDMFRCTLALILRKNSPYIGAMNFQ